jgi:iron complex outermembrane recepter protein
MKSIFLFLFCGLICCVTGQNIETINKGTLLIKVNGLDSEDLIVGAKVVATSKSDPNKIYKSITKFDGSCSLLDMEYGSYSLSVSMISFDPVIQIINIEKASTFLNVVLGGNQELEEVKVIGNLVKEGNVPVALTKISLQKITEELGSRDLPMLLNGTAGVYATQTGGGDGDARINVRGFDQRNVGVMIDGVPVNDMENGAVYWSNWFGLDAITSQMQVQRGLGATKIAMPSIGGTINILTKGIGNKKGGSFKQEYGTGNFLRSTFAYNSGMNTKGWGFTFSGSYKQADGWVYGTPSQGFFGYGKVSKKIKNHLITLSAFAAPQRHGQRSFKQGIQYFDAEKARELGVQIDSSQFLFNKGIRFNQHWGYRTNANGEKEIVNERLNFYSKPQITLKDFWKVNDKLAVSNLMYMSIGRGGGTSMLNSTGLLRDSTGLINWDLIEQENKVNSLFGTPNINPQYSATEIQSNQILLASINNHFWTGYLGQFNYTLSKKMEISGGLDVRYYEGRHYQQVQDLLGGDYFVSTANNNSATAMMRVGDKVAKNTFNADRMGIVQWTGAFGQVEYTSDKFSYFVNLSGIINGYKGVDYFQKKVLELEDTVLRIGATDTILYNGVSYNASSDGLKDYATDWKYIPGFTLKTGFSYNVHKNANAYVNLGFLNRTPQFSNVIDNNSNEFFGIISNEQILAFELGYNYANEEFGVNINTYRTNWRNKPVPYGVQVPDPQDPTEFIRININGMDAIHMGGEIDFAYKINDKLSAELMFSYGDWFWNSSKTVIVPQYDSLEVTFDAKGVHVGDAAQTALAASLRYEPIKNLYFKIQAQHFDRYYANFDPFSLKGENGGRESWKMPAYSLVNLFAGYRYPLKSVTFIASGAITNLLNTSFISDATNNQNGSFDNFDANSATVMFGGGFRFNVSLGIQF